MTINLKKKHFLIVLILAIIGYGTYAIFLKKPAHKYDHQWVMADWRMADGVHNDHVHRVIQDSVMRNPDGSIYKSYVDSSYWVPQLDTVYMDVPDSLKPIISKDGKITGYPTKKIPKIDTTTGLPGVLNYYHIETEFILHDYGRVLSRPPHLRFKKH